MRALIHAGRRALTEAVFEEALSYLPVDWPVKNHTVIGTTDPKQGILDAADEFQADLIVIGAAWFSAIERLLLGSVSRSVAHTARKPVLIVRPPVDQNQSEMRVLLACESGQTGKRLANVLGRFSWPAGAGALVMHVVENMFGGRIPDWLDAQARNPDAESFVKLWVKDHDEQLAKATQEIRGVCANMPTGLSNAELRIAEGVPEREILETAREMRSDLIVIGTKSADCVGTIANWRHE